ncbi:TetR/AcrR family transcriptional regulator [Spiribacter sp. 221]|uniref:TetR/AcrR family transcriptional regulator n=1 Tax=Spiribacter onubensis TaxID=3122420 RepID=UPI00349F87C0
MPVAQGRRRPRGEARRRILRLAAKWLQQRGYHGFSFGQIADALEIQSGAVHYHFPSKPDLVTAVFAGYRVEFAWWREQMDSSRYGPLEQVGRFLDLEARNIEGERVCPLGVAGVEYASLPAQACAEAEGLRDDLAEWLTGLLETGRLEGTLDFPGDASDQARAIMAAAQGALQLVRLHGRDDFAAVRRAILAGLTPRGV